MYRTVVTICTAQWSLYVPHSGHYMYRTVVTICTAQWSLYVPHSGHYMYRTVVTVCTAQWSLYAPHSGHYMYRTVVTVRTAPLSVESAFVSLMTGHDSQKKNVRREKLHVDTCCSRTTSCEIRDVQKTDFTKSVLY